MSSRALLRSLGSLSFVLYVLTTPFCYPRCLIPSHRFTNPQWRGPLCLPGLLRVVKTHGTRRASAEPDEGVSEEARMEYMEGGVRVRVRRVWRRTFLRHECETRSTSEEAENRAGMDVWWVI